MDSAGSLDNTRFCPFVSHRAGHPADPVTNGGPGLILENGITAGQKAGGVAFVSAPDRFRMVRSLGSPCPAYENEPTSLYKPLGDRPPFGLGPQVPNSKAARRPSFFRRSSKNARPAAILLSGGRFRFSYLHFSAIMLYP